MDSYKIYGKVGEGSYSEVFKASCLSCSRHANYPESSPPHFVAIKCLKLEQSGHRTSAATLHLQSKEAIALRKLQPHPNIVELIDVFVDPRTQRLCIVTELMTMNVFEFLQSFKHTPPAESLVRWLIFQTLCALSHLKSRGMFHRDVKPENLLLRDDTLKLGDFGSCKSMDASPPYTEYIATRWYRAPECLQTIGMYTFKMDVWSVGCVMYEMLTGKPLFAGENELQQLRCIDALLGPRQRDAYSTFRDLLPQCSPDGVALLTALLTYDPHHRPDVDEALAHPYFVALRIPPLRIIPLQREATTPKTPPKTPPPLRNNRTWILHSRTSEKLTAVTRKRNNDGRTDTSQTTVAPTTAASPGTTCDNTVHSPPNCEKVPSSSSGTPSQQHQRYHVALCYSSYMETSSRDDRKDMLVECSSSQPRSGAFIHDQSQQKQVSMRGLRSLLPRRH